MFSENIYLTVLEFLLLFCINRADYLLQSPCQKNKTRLVYSSSFLILKFAPKINYDVKHLFNKSQLFKGFQALLFDPLVVNKNQVSATLNFYWMKF